MKNLNMFFVGISTLGVLITAGCGGGGGDDPPQQTVAQAATRSTLQTGMYSLTNGDYPSGTTSLAVYAIVRLSLASDGATLMNSYTYFDRLTKNWTNTLPAGVPVSLFENSTNFLTHSGWVNTGNEFQGATVVINSDGTFTATGDGYGMKMAFAPNEVSGQSIAAQGFLRLPSWPFLAAVEVFPSGSIRYDMTFSYLTDSYQLGDSPVTNLTDLSQVPTLLFQPAALYSPIDYLNNDSSTYIYYYALFADNGTAVDIYQSTINFGQAAQPEPVKIGSGSYATTTVSGQQILEISIPDAVRTQYNILGSPIFALREGKVYSGLHLTPGTTFHGGSSWNSVAVQHLQNCFDTAAAKPVIPKTIVKALPGR